MDQANAAGGYRVLVVMAYVDRMYPRRLLVRAGWINSITAGFIYDAARYPFLAFPRYRLSLAELFIGMPEVAIAFMSYAFVAYRILEIYRRGAGLIVSLDINISLPEVAPADRQRGNLVAWNQFCAIMLRYAVV